MDDRQNVLVGKTITGISLADDRGAIKFDIQGEDPIIARCDGDCCSNTWVEDVIDPQAVVGHVVTKAEDIDLPEHLCGPTKTNYGEEEMQYYGFLIETANGRCTIAYRNSSNGYYGGNLAWPDEHFYGGVYDQNQSTEQWKAL